MSDNAAERVEAAATGAAAAVAAIEDQQADEERAERQEAATEVATGAADLAAQQAAEAAEAATAAAEAATEALQEADNASDVAQEAAAEAYDVRADMDGLRTEMREGWSTLRQYLDEKFSTPQNEEPTEVVVTHESGTDNSTESRADGGSSTSAGNGSEPRRHKFGRRI